MAAADQANVTFTDTEIEQLLGLDTAVAHGAQPCDVQHDHAVVNDVSKDAVDSRGEPRGDLAGFNDLLVDNNDREAEDYANFPNWIPTFVVPDQPCDYCRAKQLDCFMYFGKITCTACNSLWRPCSFARVSPQDTEILQEPNQGVVDTLQIVEEDVCMEHGGLTGIKSLRSKTAPRGPKSDDTKKATNRFSKAAVRVLRDWFDVNADSPYPTEDQKLELEKQTGLKQTQIATWLANTRRRSKTAKLSKRTSLATETQSNGAIDIPQCQISKGWKDLNPFERWQHSPPEHEPARMNDIADAVKNSEFLVPERPASASRNAGRTGSTSSLSIHRAPSSASMEIGQESVTNSKSNSRSNSSIVWSQGSQSSFGSFNSFGSGLHGKRDRRRKRRSRVPATKTGSGEDKQQRIYQCTFCCDTFRTKYDWTRHEKTLHLSLEKWICSPLGPMVTDSQTGIKACVYCRESNPTREHIDSHGHKDCESKGIEARTFYRKDHLRQHLRLVHRCELLPGMESWKASADFIKSRCGFCSQRFTSWSERNDHLAAHFKSGARMRDWTKCRGLDPEVAANVLNAMPPYLIGMESESPDPFSASGNRLSHSQVPLPGASRDDPEGVPEGAWDSVSTNEHGNGKASCWEILTVSLGKYCKERADAGVSLTDGMLQKQARIILYGDDDDWNQTAADNPEWLDLFKKAHGLNMIPSAPGVPGPVVPEDLELYIDLGLRVPFSIRQRLLAQESQGRQQDSTSASTPNISSGCNTARTSWIGSPITPACSVPSLGDINKTTLGPTPDGVDYHTYERYSYLPIPADRAALFADGIRDNPMISINADMQQGRTSSYSPTMSPEQEEAWAKAVAEEAAGLGLTVRPVDESMLGGLDTMDVTPKFAAATLPEQQPSEDQSSQPYSLSEAPDMDAFDFDTDNWLNPGVMDLSSPGGSATAMGAAGEHVSGPCEASPAKPKERIDYLHLMQGNVEVGGEDALMAMEDEFDFGDVHF